MALRREDGTDFRECNTSTGKIRVWTLAKNLYVTQGEGHMQDEHAAFLEGYGADRLQRAGGKVYIFHDWMELTGYDSKTRYRLTTWSAEHRATFEEVHLAVRSPLVAMGVQVANIALGGFMRVHTGVATLELELARVLSVIRVDRPKQPSRFPSR
jgi:hypothetical protein